MTTGTATTTVSAVMLSDLWGDARSARKARLAVGALIVAAVAIGMTAPAMDASGIAFVLGLSVAILGWLAWTLLPPRLETTVVALAAISLGGSVVVASGGRGAAAAAAFPLIAVAAATERLPLPLAFLVAATAFVSLLAGALIAGSSLTLVLAFVVPLAGLIAGLAPRQHVARLEQAELLLAESQRATEEQARAAALDERLRIAREVHDVLAHSLAALSISLEVTHALLADERDPDAALVQVERSQQLVTQGIAETRQAVAALRTEVAPLPIEIARLVDDYGRETGSDTSFSSEGEPRRLPPEAEFACRRVAQEALTNARKHAAGAHVLASLEYGPSEVRLLVRSEGGLPSTQPLDASSGYGIAGMRERAQLLEGRLTAGEVKGGWQVELRIPA